MTFRLCTLRPYPVAWQCGGRDDEAAANDDLIGYFAYFLRCESALPAADFDAAEVRPSRNTCDAALAAARDVDSRGLWACVKALAAAVFDALPVLEEFNTFAAAVAALEPVVLFAMSVFLSVKGVGRAFALPTDSAYATHCSVEAS